jgi:hypothetical protein
LFTSLLKHYPTNILQTANEAKCEKMVFPTSSFGRVSAAESRVSRSYVGFGFLGLALFWAALGFSAFETGLFQLSTMNRELAFNAPCT